MRSLAVALLALAGASDAATMRLGVNTHFDQNWPLAALDQVEQSGAATIRDAVSWGKVETRPGRYDFAAAAYADSACKRGLRLSITLTPRNRIYESGASVATPAGRRAFGAFARATVDRFPCIAALEIGNEINDHSLSGPMLSGMPGSYVAIVAALRDALAGARPVALLSGSTLSVATGFYQPLLDAGLGRLVDGIVVHPYIGTPEQLPWQLARLDAAMAVSGARKPISASEFGLDYATPEDAPPHALKMVTLMSAAGIAEADWYALRDEPAFRNTGLFGGGAAKPALATFRTAVTRLLARGQASRVDAGDPLTFVYRFGPGPYVMWGSGRALTLPAGAKAFDARGAARPLPRTLGPEPIIVEGGYGVRFGPPPVLADSLIGYGSPGWSWSVDRPAGPAALRWIDWKWASYQGLPGTQWRALANLVALGPNRDASLIERYRAERPFAGFVAACFAARSGDRARVSITAPGAAPLEVALDGERSVAPRPLRLGAGDELTIRYSGVDGAAVVRRRVQIVADAAVGAPACPPGKANPRGGGDAPDD